MLSGKSPSNLKHTRKFKDHRLLSQCIHKNQQSELVYRLPKRTTEQSTFAVDVNLPFIKDKQQTLRQSFIIGGVGLHGGDFTYVRVSPAFPREGRYFVLVPEGIISEHPSQTADKRTQDVECENICQNPRDDMRYFASDQHAEALITYYTAKHKGIRGSVEEFEEGIFKDIQMHSLPKMCEKFHEKNTKTTGLTTYESIISPRTEDEIYIPANIEFARGEVHYTALVKDEVTISSVEHLLAALQACGVDNCRIELEGGREIPIIDGSSHGWTTLINRVGVAPCDIETPKGVIKVTHPFTMLGENGSFVSVFPSQTSLVTAGWDAVSRGSPSLGRTWHTWDIERDAHFHYSIAPAKTFYHSEFELDALYDSGLVQAGPTLCAIVGKEHVFQNPEEVTFPDDEAARHKIIDLNGDLALLCRSGNGGTPVGHFLAWNADHSLQLKFCIHLWNEFLCLGLN